MATKVKISKTIYNIVEITESYSEYANAIYTTYRLKYKNTTKTMVGGIHGFTLYADRYGRRALGKKVEPQFIC